ncbi:NADH dehydrogenase [ubiquinone] 1 beta subcomplex subunit 9 [Amphibalanus amphitrite]|uniref:NADH dehydrogenase [ubiquinone] 1 beta subcomplex subunit 9 n=1 Tax=Amphibalanus amphitrite TaxID=1232801 RepID=A0A6A4WSD8_AMPAM|nr:NADH dehydrogenase [ubiquinone] 1 beta subcomplex subunit 9-like [Amphibalanus amphitrite]XP_043200033.1 NADH dehydrogenase [ubiquinone] 1 beta subcomplex subunit 9-like [Amphibalanus amphitrite]KAF0306704.1 NADH dehydrogenase [ubiquinone] 1 beta subcomplex subunit 9 [Amphibalanus amphitrite]KAF0310001.1 NADH dehydrogenase [ubiquinone] 1 beta subcomplex subunit 9 [Amphibalanus amphitrite]
MSFLQTSALTHQQKVKSLYKRGLRLLEMYLHHRHHFRYNAVLLRAEFDQHKNERDMIKVKKLMEDAEYQLWSNQHYQPKQFPDSPGGVAHGRVVVPPDWVLDYWHPLEKAMYPEYFARREERKAEYVKWWNSQYGEPEPAGDKAH